MHFNHPLILKHKDVVKNIMINHSLGSGRTLKNFRIEIMESISNYYLIREGIDGWIPDFEPEHPRYVEFDKEVRRIYEEYVWKDK